jgi:hypothetical protein
MSSDTNNLDNWVYLLYYNIYSESNFNAQWIFESVHITHLDSVVTFVDLRCSMSECVKHFKINNKS